MPDWFALAAHDTLFFRDGRPFNQDDEGLTTAESMFPPPPNTLVGGFRAACAAANGWDGSGTWSAQGDLTQQLGDGDNLGPLGFEGPILARTTGGRDDALQPLYAVPLHLLARKAEDTVSDPVLLRPSKDGVMTDVPLQPERLDQDDQPAMQRMLEPPQSSDAEDGKTLGDWFITAEGMGQILAGEVPSAVAFVPRRRLWQREPRIGLARQPETHSARHGMLYLADHIRLDRDTRLLLGVSGLNPNANHPSVGAFGRFRRLADIDRVSRPPAWPTPVAPSTDGADRPCRYVVVLTTPARFEDDGWRRVGGELSGLRGKIVTAALGRPVWIGGWRAGDYAGHRKGPRDLEPYLPAGSVWFLEHTPGGGDLQDFAWPTAIGSRTEWGFGGCLIGRWPQ